MSPKIDQEQHLHTANGSFVITGPLGNWDADDGAAVVTFVVSQTQNGNVATGIGKSQVYRPGGSTKWSADVTVVNGTQFRAGTAVVSAWASIATTDGGWELYPWGRNVTLINP